MSTTVANLLEQHPTNFVYSTNYTTSTDKTWARRYHPIRNLTIHSTIGEDGLTYVDFQTAFLPWSEDGDLRMSAPAVPPNQRTWRFVSEADCELWFNSEISNIVLAAWNEFPLVTQSSHIKPPRVESIPEEVDSTYTVRYRGQRSVLVIGEMKRNLVSAAGWQRGEVSREPQKKLPQELRGCAAHFSPAKTIRFHCHVCHEGMWEGLVAPVRCKPHRDANREWGTLGHRRRPEHKVVHDYSRACTNCDPDGSKYPDPWDYGDPAVVGQVQGEGDREGHNRGE
ncbi:hypothetical protein VTK56DRAFT_1496 [Thermocarpiscus australiensis]